MIKEMSHLRKDRGKNLNNLIKSKPRPKPQPRQEDLATRRRKVENMIAKVEWKEMNKMKRPITRKRFASLV